MCHDALWFATFAACSKPYHSSPANAPYVESSPPYWMDYAPIVKVLFALSSPDGNKPAWGRDETRI